MVEKHLDPKIKWVWMLPKILYTLILWVILLAVDYFVTSEHMLFGTGLKLSAILLLAGMVVFVLLPIYAYYLLLYEAFTYELTDTDVVISEGVITKHRTVIPYSRITDVHADRSMLYRLLGVVEVYIKTPGPTDKIANEGIIPAVSEKEYVARQIADRVSLLKNKLQPEKEEARGVGDLGAKTERQLLTEILEELRKQNDRE